MVNVVGLISVIIFYLIILAIGIWAGRKKSKNPGSSEEEIMVAGRNIGVFVGIFTMTATWVGGGYINGTAEAMYDSGIVWCQAPFGYALSLVFGGLFFAKQMREQGYVTMLDPFQRKFGQRMGGLLYIPALCGEIFWAAAILNALAATLSIIIEMDRNTSVIVSACIAVFYTVFGGLYSVAYTDVVQLFCIFLGLWLCIPFAFTHDAVGSFSGLQLGGTLAKSDVGTYIDFGLLLIFGGIPWQVYFQRVLSSKTASGAQILSYAAAFGCFLMAIPPVLMGAVARATDWNATEYGVDPSSRDESGMVVPLVMFHLTPVWVSFFGLGAISAAVMSSADSSVLSAASMFARNIYRNIFRQHASSTEVIWVMRFSILVVGVIASVMALTISSVYGLWALSSDLVYVLLFPQLLMVVHFNAYCNTYGSLTAYLLAFFFRAAGGEDVLSLPALIHYPGYDEETGIQQFPFRTLCMLISLVTLIVVSKITDFLFTNGYISTRHDYFKCFVPAPKTEDISATANAMNEMKTVEDKGQTNGQINKGFTDMDMKEPLPPSFNQATKAVGQNQSSEIYHRPPPSVTDVNK